MAAQPDHMNETGAFLVEVRPLGRERDAFVTRESFPGLADARRRAGQALREWAADDLEQIAGRMDVRDPCCSPPLAALYRTIAERLELAERIGAEDGPLEVATTAGEVVVIRPA